MPSIPSALYYLPRRAHIFGTAAVVYLILKTTQLLDKLLRRSDDASDAAWARANTRAAQLVLRTSAARRGLWIKCCQYVAARSDALPPEYAVVLAKSLDDCPPTRARAVAALVDAQLAQSADGRAFAATHGRPPVAADLFDGFDPASPIASASIAQVHVATHRASGRRVVLKVQHPGVRPMLLQDLRDLRTLIAWVAGAEPRFDMRPVLDAWIDMVPLETDFVNERRNLDAVRTALARAPPDLATSASVPAPLPALSTDRLLVMDFVDGVKLSDRDAMASATVNRERLVREIARSFGCQLFVCNVFSGDPHPGNFLVDRLAEGGHPVLLDFGICVPVSDQLRRAFARLVLAALDSDSYSLLRALSDVGLKLNRADPVASLDIIQYLFRTTAPNDESRKEQSAFRARLESRKDEIERNERENAVDGRQHKPVSADGADADLEKQTKKPEKRESRSPVDSFPGDLVFFFRSLGMLRGLATSLDVRLSYLDVLRPYAEYTLRNAVPVERRLQHAMNARVVAEGGAAKRAAQVLEGLFEKLYDNGMIVGMQVAACVDGELVLDVAAGRMGRYNERPVEPDSLFNSFSTTKGLSAILFASVQDKHGVEYGDLVGKYWPEFAKNGKESTTIEHILSHSAGLANTLPDDMAMARLRDDWQGIIRHFEDAEPSHPPGERSEYHAISFGWLIAGLITKITGRSYQDNLAELTATLGIDTECYCGNMPADLLEEADDSRVAALTSAIYQDIENGPLSKVVKAKRKSDKANSSDSEAASPEPDKLDAAAARVGDMQAQRDRALRSLNLPAGGSKSDKPPPAYLVDVNFFNHPVLRAGFVPSANGHFSARALARLYSAVANDGRANGARVLAPGRAARMQERVCDVAGRAGRAWGAGLTLYDTVGQDGLSRPRGAVGHGGIGGSMAFAVPEARFSMAVTLNKLNAVSVSTAIVIAVVCKTLGVPTPEWYYRFAKRALTSFREDGLDGISDESQLMERMMGGDGEVDMMRMLIG